LNICVNGSEKFTVCRKSSAEKSHNKIIRDNDSSNAISALFSMCIVHGNNVACYLAFKEFTTALNDHSKDKHAEAYNHAL